MANFPKTTVTSKNLILDVEKLRRANAKPTAGTTYREGDLLVIDANNVATHATEAGTWDVIGGALISSEATKEMPVYFGGVFNVNAVTINGVELTDEQKDQARATATKNRIELAKI